MNTRRQNKKQRCQRCSLFYPDKEPACTHCAGWSDEQVLAVKDYVEQQKRANKNIGKWFLFAAGTIMFLVTAALLMR